MVTETETRIKQLQREVNANSRQLNAIRMRGGINSSTWKELSLKERVIVEEIKALTLSLYRKIGIVG